MPFFKKQLFERLCQQPEQMPGYFQKLAEKEGPKRTVCDYIAGMTDRFCLRMLKEIQPEPSDEVEITSWF